MSVVVSNFVWAHSAHRDGALLVLLAMADHAHDDGASIFPSVATLAGKARITKRHAQRLIRELESSGEIVRERRGGGRGLTARWRIVMAAPARKPAPVPRKRAAGSTATEGGTAEEFTPEQIKRNLKIIDGMLNGVGRNMRDIL